MGLFEVTVFFPNGQSTIWVLHCIYREYVFYSLGPLQPQIQAFQTDEMSNPNRDSFKRQQWGGGYIIDKSISMGLYTNKKRELTINNLDLPNE